MNVIRFEARRRLPPALPLPAPQWGMPARDFAAVRPPRPARRWSINGDFTTLAPTGVARYAREVTLALDALVAERHPLADNLALDLVVPRPIGNSLPLGSIPVRLVPEFNKPRLPQVWVQMQLPLHVPGGLLSFCNLAPVAVRRQIVCIHDLHTRIMPESYGRGFRLAHRIILPMLGRRAARITTVSQLSRRHLAEFDVAVPEKVTVTYNGSDHVLRWDEHRAGLEPESGRPYVLCLGRNQKYKNLDLLVRIAPILDLMGLDMWMAGEIGESALGPDRPANLRLLGRIGDDDFKRALRGALCFLFPSRIEGFGLPAVEAMAAGCPVIASTSPCLPEVCGEAALYADPDEPSVWASLVGQLRQDHEQRQRLVDAGYAQAARYTWRGIAEIYLRLMAEVDGVEVPSCSRFLDHEGREGAFGSDGPGTGRISW